MLCLSNIFGKVTLKCTLYFVLWLHCKPQLIFSTILILLTCCSYGNSHRQVRFPLSLQRSQFNHQMNQAWVHLYRISHLPGPVERHLNQCNLQMIQAWVHLYHISHLPGRAERRLHLLIHRLNPAWNLLCRRNHLPGRAECQLYLLIHRLNPAWVRHSQTYHHPSPVEWIMNALASQHRR